MGIRAKNCINSKPFNFAVPQYIFLQFAGRLFLVDTHVENISLAYWIFICLATGRTCDFFMVIAIVAKKYVFNLIITQRPQRDKLSVVCQNDRREMEKKLAYHMEHNTMESLKYGRKLIFVDTFSRRKKGFRGKKQNPRTTNP